MSLNIVKPILLHSQISWSKGLNVQTVDKKMKESLFRKWLGEQGYNFATIDSRISNCHRISDVEGDLDVLFEQDQYEDLIMRLSYSTQDEKENARPRHDVQIKGNIRTGTATLKQAARLYYKFMLEHSLKTETTPEDKSKNSGAHPQEKSIQEAKSSKELDSYALFLDYFNIDKDSFYEFGVENTIFSPLDYAKNQWSQTKERLLNNQKLSIRGYGRQGKNTDLFLDLYRHLFNNEKITEDPSNNTAAKKNIQSATGYRVNNNVYNFQCSHIFGCTKNPLLFEAVWNICLVPKMFDPLTGHETKGPWPKEYQDFFIQTACLRYKDFIEDYNEFLVEHNVLERIEQYVSNIKKQYDERVISKFSSDARSEWAPIEISRFG